MQVPMYYPAPQTTTTTAFIGGGQQPQQQQQQILCCNPTPNTLYSSPTQSQYQTCNYNTNGINTNNPYQSNQVSSVIPSYHNLSNINYNNNMNMNMNQNNSNLNHMNSMNNMNNMFNANGISMLNMASTANNNSNINANINTFARDTKYNPYSSTNCPSNSAGGTQTNESKLHLRNTAAATLSGSNTGNDSKPQYTLITSYTPGVLNGINGINGINGMMNLSNYNNPNHNNHNISNHNQYNNNHNNLSLANDALNGTNLNIFPITTSHDTAPTVNSATNTKNSFMTASNNNMNHANNNAFNMTTMPCPPSMQINHSTTSTTSTSSQSGSSPTSIQHANATNISIQPISNNTNVTVPTLPHNLNFSNMVAQFPNVTAFELTQCPDANQNSLVNILNNDLGIPSLKTAQNALIDSNSNSGNHEGKDKKNAGAEALKRFGCTYCGKRFTLKQNLKVHIRVHTGERPFKCKYCPKRFKDSRARINHHLTHTGEKPHECTVCHKRFGQRSSYTRHLKSQTHKQNEKKFGPPITIKTQQ